MSEEKKPGFFARLFGRGKNQEVLEPEIKVEEAPAPVEIAPPPEPVAEKPEPTPKKAEPKKPASKKPVAKKAAAKPKAAEPKTKPAAKKPAPKKEATKPAPLAKAKSAPKSKPKVEKKPKPAPEPKADVKPKPAAKPAAKVVVPPEPPEPLASDHDVTAQEPSLDEELSHLDPGPPETTPEWIEEHPVAAKIPELAPAPEPEKKSWFQRLASGLKRSSDQLTDNISAVFTKRKLDADTLEELEDILIQADLGIDTAMTITEALAKDRFDKEISAKDVRTVLADEVIKVLEPVALPLEIDAKQSPFVILMIGVNGSGKTTTIGKMAQKLKAEGKSVMLAAGDTFRAAAIEQLQVWGTRTGTPVVARPTGSDASGLAFDAVGEAKEAGSDVLIIDTAGRLQNRDELMAELEKIIRVIKKVDASAPHAVLLTLDATTGQNALNQVEIFGQRAGVTGLVMTKLDGTARGGILVAIAKKFELPVHYIGVGEGVDDLESFEAKDFAEAIAGGE